MKLANDGKLRERFYAFLFLFCLAVTVVPRHSSLYAQSSLLAPVPPMGWNSWDAYGTTVREEEVKANADVMASALKRYGWQYVVVDIQWYEPDAKAHGYRDGAALAMDGDCNAKSRLDAQNAHQAILLLQRAARYVEL